MTARARQFWACFLLGACTALAGCGTKMDYSGIELIKVTGTVTFDGQPLPDALVIFEGTDSASSGRTDANGRFTLQFDSVKSGCTPGKKTVRISTRLAQDSEADPNVSSKDEAAAEKIPDVYNSKSTLTADVSSSNRSFQFDLKTRGE